MSEVVSGTGKTESLSAGENEASRRNTLCELGRKSLKGFAFGVGMMVPVLGGGVWFASHVKNEANALFDEKIQQVEKTGNGWIVTFRQENTDKLVPPLKDVKDSSCAIAQRLPGGTQPGSNTANTTTPITANEVCPEIVNPSNHDEAAPAPTTSSSLPTPQETVTTLPPDIEGNAAP